MSDCPYEIEVDGRLVAKCNCATDFDTAYERALDHANHYHVTARLYFGGKSYDVEPIAVPRSTS